jgi:hypothetical protein
MVDVVNHRAMIATGHRTSGVFDTYAAVGSMSRYYEDGTGLP